MGRNGHVLLNYNWLYVQISVYSQLLMDKNTDRLGNIIDIRSILMYLSSICSESAKFFLYNSSRIKDSTGP